MLFVALARTNVHAETINGFDIHKINDQVYILTKKWSDSSKANIGVVVGDDGLLLINTLMKTDLTALETTLKTISTLPVKYVINSNWDTYNHENNEYFAKKGATILGHDNLRYRPVYTQLTFQNSISLTVGEELITAYRSGAHSFGHVNVHLKHANVIFMADSYRNDWMTVTGPFGVDGHLEGVRSVLALANEQTLIIPGNTLNKVFSNREDLLLETNIRKKFKARIQTLFDQGLSAEAIAKDKDVESLFNTYYPERHFSPKSKVIQALQTDFIKPIALNEKQISNYVGKYRSEDQQEIEILYVDNQFIARSNNQFIVLLIAISKSDFIFATSTKEDKFIFKMNEKGQVIEFNADVGRSYFRFFIKQSRWAKVLPS